MWKKLLQPKVSLPVTKKSDISQRREPVVCILCVEEGKANFNIVDSYKSSIQRHVNRNHFETDYDVKKKNMTKAS